MSILPKIIGFSETAPIPDFVLRAGVNMLVGNTRDRLKNQIANEAAFAKNMKDYSIATHTQDANEQHYELPSRFFELCLGKNRKYSSCLFNAPDMTLDEAEDLALAQTAKNADLKDGQAILELGCGWGSLSLYMARNFPNAKIVSVSNSHSQRQFIEEIIKSENLTNLTIITKDMNDFIPETKFDRVVSVEMFEHMSNWDELLRRVKSWLLPDGALFMHIFTHKAHSYRFDINDDADWIAKYFFAGGVMPSQNLIYEFSDVFKVENHIVWNGDNYRKTADLWLENFDKNFEEIEVILSETYGKDKDVWIRRWRLFYMATSGLFGFDKGNEWYVSHYLLRPI